MSGKMFGTKHLSDALMPVLRKAGKKDIVDERATASTVGNADPTNDLKTFSANRGQKTQKGSILSQFKKCLDRT